ncbi:hypothetical protein LOZ51_003521 [Ophidiomyces ophidiicola]|nr:hypothetical protein LOZ51_003521 [Ophidiomyces ophidiicola]
MPGQNLLESFSESSENISTESDSESDKSLCKEDLTASLQKCLAEKSSDVVYLSTLICLYSKKVLVKEKKLLKTLWWNYFICLCNDDISDLVTKIFQSLDIMCGDKYFVSEHDQYARDIMKNWKYDSIKHIKVDNQLIFEIPSNNDFKYRS